MDDTVAQQIVYILISEASLELNLYGTIPIIEQHIYLYSLIMTPVYASESLN